VLATDDQTQNRANSSGLLLARELLGSAIEPRLDVSIYEAEKLNERFDVILCMGIYYHLIDPFIAFAQLRHCCHSNSIVVVEGDISEGTRANMPFYDFSTHDLSVFVPTPRVLEQMLGASYFEVVSQARLLPSPDTRISWRQRLDKGWRAYRETVSEEIDRFAPGLNRAFTICRPFTGQNKLHRYRPPFALHQYDDRFT
jgi:tRNA (mo5U34)-methyltransferase